LCEIDDEGFHINSNTQETAVIWFRNDLRLADNPALNAAIATGLAVLPVFIQVPEEGSQWPLGGATKWWLHHSLKKLNESLVKCGSKLIVRSGNASEILLALVEEANVRRIFWNRLYEPESIARDSDLKSKLQVSGVQVESFNGSLLFEPWEVRTGEGKPFQVFTPFWRACLAANPPSPPISAPKNVRSPERWPVSLSIDDLMLEPTIDWAAGIREMWTPGEQGAMQRLHNFTIDHMPKYACQRDNPANEGTSRLSPHMHFGEISPRQIWHELIPLPSSGPYLRQVIWREFAHYMLYHHPRTPQEPFRAEFRNFPWRADAAKLQAWTRALTGYPLVDAGMRELWHTGWMHNRVRMVVASFLVKHLLQPWQEGAAWFWDTLVDADLANNTFGWQWVAGCGADAAPYFRIFNPMLQSKKFDPNGDYIRRWVPELRGLSNDSIHEPWLATVFELADAGIKLGVSYPYPIIDHVAARNAALEAFQTLRDNNSQLNG